MSAPKCGRNILSRNPCRLRPEISFACPKDISRVRPKPRGVMSGSQSFHNLQGIAIEEDVRAAVILRAVFTRMDSRFFCTRAAVERDGNDQASRSRSKRDHG